MADEVFTSIPTDAALRQAEIGAMRMLSDSVNRLAGRMDAFGEDVSDIKQKVTVIEARNFDMQIAKLELDTEKAFTVRDAASLIRDTNISNLQQQMAKFGAYVAMGAAILAAAVGAMATKVFGA